MTDAILGSVVFAGVLFLSFIPVNNKIGGDLGLVMGTYVATFFFRALCILGAFFAGARLEVLFAIILSVILEVVALVRISTAEEKSESLA